jgi:hypothetical protein
MGMFDYLRCDYPLPARALAQGLVYQTKDFDCLMDEIHILADGTLMGQDYDIEDRSDPNATGLAALAGRMTRVNVRPKPLSDYDGEIEFYADYGDRNSNGWGEGWLEFKAVVQLGKVVSVTLIEDRVPLEILAEERRAALMEEVGLDPESDRAPSLTERRAL